MASQQSTTAVWKVNVINGRAMANPVAPVTASKPVSLVKQPTEKANQLKKPKPNTKSKATQPTPRLDLLERDEPVAFDAEFQDFREPGEGWLHRLAWAAIVGSRGQVILSVGSRYEDQDKPGTERKLPPRRFGVTWDMLKYRNGAVNGKVVESYCKKIFAGRIVVVHGGKGDISAFQYEKPFEGAAKVIDTQVLYSYMQFDGTPGLATLMSLVLGKIIQGGGKGEHSPVVDAQSTIELAALKGVLGKYGKLEASKE
ncbi:hypothetical protein PRZ48_007461 [Zasmidium cellare]|uniref:Exonuclease domain-containing protein n=1 Tax=Zasmidium cellare TaxID=395010 RepID=A0ABR0EJE0_ZASCE|nr:hypothetical protein PRZ48_007461 [Zasmidium cellare]